MSRPLRILYPGAWYHVMNRGLERRKVFGDSFDYEAFCQLLGETCHLWGLEVHAFSLMPNHYHLLVRTALPNLPRCMRHLNGVYTQKFNRRHRRDGPLLRGRYKAILVEEEQYLVELVRYIHLNPVMAGLDGALGEHRWTSHWHYCRPKEKPDWLRTDFVLSYFDRTEKKAIRLFHSFVKEGVPERLRVKLSNGRWPSILGGAQYRDWAIDNFVMEQRQKTAIPAARREIRRYKLQNILRAVSDVYDCSIADLRRAQKGRGNEARKAAIYLVWEYMGMAQERIAKVFKDITATGIAQSNKRLRNQLKEDRYLKEKVRSIRRRIEQSVL